MAERGGVGQPLAKIDSLALAAGQERFTADFPLERPLHCALLYSPHAHAEIASIDAHPAMEVPGVADVLCFENVPRVLHTTAGQGFPEPSPYDTVLFDRTVRYAGDRVALVAAESEEIAREAAARILVEYRPLGALTDSLLSMDPSSPRLHGAEAHAAIPAVYDASRNLAAEVEIRLGDPAKAFADADFVDECEYAVQAVSHCAMEPHAAFARLDERDRLVIVTSTQVPFHARRIVSALLGLPLNRVRVIKPRVGGGFGGKQEVILEPLVALVALRNRRAARLVLSRREVFVSTRTRHAMRIRLKTGSSAGGGIAAVEMEALANAGAYGTHSLTVVSNTGAKVLPLFNKIGHVHFLGRAVYTSLPVAGALRGYGAPQGYFALNQQLDIVSRRAGIDMPELCARWHIRKGETSPVFEAIGEGGAGTRQVVRSCRLSECIEAGSRAIGWAEKRGKRIEASGRVRGVGMAVAMQGSGIPLSDMGAASMRMNEDGSFTLLVGAVDIGTGSDTVLAQIAAEVLAVPVERILVIASDTDATPFDSGAYASSTTYVSGKAVELCARKLAGRIRARAAGKLSADAQEQVQAHASFVCQESPPPFVAQFAEVEVDRETGRVDVVRFVSAVDCGRPINPMLVEGQVDGATAMAISQALWEEYLYDDSSRMTNPRFWDYRICGSRDVPEIMTLIVESEEPTGPFGAKSVGEVAMNGPAPAIANAIYDAVGARMRETPFTPERVWREMNR